MVSISNVCFIHIHWALFQLKKTGELATAGYFEEAAGFLPGEGEVLQLQLLGVTQPATAVGTRVRVQIQGLDGPEPWRKLQCFFGKFFHGLNPPYLSKSIGKMYVL